MGYVWPLQLQATRVSITELEAVSRSDSKLQSLETSTVVSLCLLPLLARFCRLISACVNDSWCGATTCDNCICAYGPRNLASIICNI